MDVVPKTTAQQKKFNTKTKTFYKTNDLKVAEMLLRNAFQKYVPAEPFTTAIKMTVVWQFNHTKKSKEGQYKDTAPDLDNLQKNLQDILAKMGFYNNDAKIVELTTSKIYSENTGIRITIEEAKTIDEEILGMLRE